MATEDELRAALHRHAAGLPVGGPGADGAGSGAGLDAARVVRRSRLRRAPRQLAVGGAGVLAVAGIAFVGIQAGLPLFGGPAQDSALAPTSAELSDGGGQEEAALPARRPPADRINLCGAPVATIDPAPSGLELLVAAPPTGPVGTDPIPVTVLLTNTGADRVTGELSGPPTLVLAGAGVTVWHTDAASAPATAPVRVDLGPGESLELAAELVPVACSPQDDAVEGVPFPPDLPALPGGPYQLSALADFLPDSADGPGETTGVELVGGAVLPFRLN